MKYLYSCVLILWAVSYVPAQDINEKLEATTKTVVEKVAPSVVKIETSGGTEVVGGGAAGGPGAGVRKGVGPTTGLVVDPDGYIITSSFNFANKPTDMFVTVPGRPRLVATIVATDNTRMLTLLKVNAKDLPVPTALPKKDFQVGKWAVAVGRTLNPDANGYPSVSCGIISALGRIYGRCVQTDAKVSPVNYGGPLVALDGKVYGVLVPASPRGEGDTAGIEWYDSGIGFAVPLEDIFAVLPKLKQGKNLQRGLLGVTFQNAESPYFDPPLVEKVSPDSAAAKLGMKRGDVILAVDGKPVPHITALQFILGPKYDGDTISLTIKRDGKEQTFDKVNLSASANSFTSPYLGILPMRDDPELGLEVRYIYPGSPADKAGIKANDRIIKVQPPAGLAPPGKDAMQSFQGRTGLAQMIGLHQPGDAVQLMVRRKEGGKTDTVTVNLTAMPDEVPSVLPHPSSMGKALATPKEPEGAPVKPKPKPADKKPDEKKPDDKKPDEKKEIETGLLKKNNTTLGREYWVYVPSTYTPDVAHGAIVWLHAAGKGGKDAEDVVKIWKPFCEAFHFIIIGPTSRNPNGWLPSETEGIVTDVKETLNSYTIDRTRVIAHGMGIGGQMGFYLGFNARDIIRGVAVSGAVLGTQPKDNLPAQPLAFYIVAGDKDPNLKDITEGKAKLNEKKFPVIYREIKDFGKEYLTDVALEELQRWMDSLDRI